MKYSVIVPVYNGEKYLKQCLSSVVSQIRESDELIIIDDGSKDHSKEIYYAFAREYPQIKVIQQENQGVYAARQCGIRHATGDYIIFVDADDTWTENTLSEIDSLLTEGNVDMLIFNYQKITDDGEAILNPPVCTTETIFRKCESRELFLKVILSGAYNAVWSKVIRRECISSLQTLPGKRVKIGEDFLQSLFFLENADTFVYTPLVLYNYRTNLQSASFYYEESRISDLLTVYTYLYEILTKTCMEDIEIERAFWNLFFETLHYNSIKFWSTAKLNAIVRWNNAIRSNQLFSLGIKKEEYRRIRFAHKLSIFTITHRLLLLSMGLGFVSKWKRNLKS